jgi:hypothetical protein
MIRSMLMIKTMMEAVDIVVVRECTVRKQDDDVCSG